MIDGAAGGRVAYAHDWLVTRRGGERVLERLVELLGPGPIHTLIAGAVARSGPLASCRIVTSPLQRLPARWRRAALPLMPWAVSRLRVEPCDLLVSTSSAVIKAIRPPAGTPHLCYCHSPPRYLWDLAADYAIGAGGTLRRVGLAAFGEPLRRWDRATASRVTAFLANSAFTARRIERCWGREAAVVHPPVRTGFFTPAGDGRPRADWLLVAGALEPYKRADLAVAAANAGRLPLRIAGTGTQLAALRRAAGPTVQVLGAVGDETLRELYRRASALLHPQVEDFGLTAVEAQACGCPVVAYRAGGALETVTERTGVFFDERTPEGILDAVRRLRERGADPDACRENALRFSEAHFDRGIREAIRALPGAPG